MGQRPPLREAARGMQAAIFLALHCKGPRSPEWIQQKSIHTTPASLPVPFGPGLAMADANARSKLKNADRKARRAKATKGNLRCRTPKNLARLGRCCPQPPHPTDQRTGGIDRTLVNNQFACRFGPPTHSNRIDAVEMLDGQSRSRRSLTPSDNSSSSDGNLKPAKTSNDPICQRGVKKAARARPEGGIPNLLSR